MKRPTYINGVTSICCGSRVGQCEDCPQREAHERGLAKGIAFRDGLWWRDGVGYKTWEQADIGTPAAQPGDTWRAVRKVLGLSSD